MTSMKPTNDAPAAELPLPGVEYAVGEVVAERYRISALLWTERHSTVYEVRHLRLGQRLALRVLPTERRNRASARARFERAAQALGALHSPHVLKILDAGTLDTGHVYVITELPDGKRLREVLESQGPMAPEEAARLMHQACQALSEAHQLDIVHCNVTPDSLLIVEYVGHLPMVKLFDFRLARLDGSMATIAAIATSLTSTPSAEYQSPEQMRNPTAVDLRSDLWSVGATLFKMVSGTTPFGSCTVPELLMRLANDDVRALEAVVPGTDAELCAVVRKCLRVDRRDRFGSADELACALEPFARRAWRAPPRPRGTAD
jgi:serine/threonine-protein kinase